MRKKTHLFGLAGYGLSAGRLHRLGSRSVKFSVNLKGRPQLPLLRYKPSERQRRLGNVLQRQKRRLMGQFPEASLRPRGNPGWTLDGMLPANRLRALVARPEVDFVFIEEIEGLRSKPSAPRDSWYCVWGKVAIQVESKTRGLVDVEDRFVLVRATGPEDAQRRLAQEWREYARPHLNSYGYAVRWKLLGIEDVYDLNQEDIDPRGTEVYSRIRSKRMKSRYRWRRTKGRRLTTA